MKIFAVLSVVWALISPTSFHKGDYYVDLVRYAGCEAELIEDENEGPAGSFFVVYADGPIIVLGVKEDSDLPLYVGTMVLLHEVGHCLQYQENMLGGYGDDPKSVELDADRRAADLACGMGMDGRGMLRDLFEWARDVLGYRGDPFHGTTEERIAQGDKAMRCDKPSIQS